MRNVLKNLVHEKDLMKEYHIILDKKTDFYDINLVIGKNGSGKTRMLRFLNAYAIKNKYMPIFIDCSGIDQAMDSECSTNVISPTLLFNVKISEEVSQNMISVFRQQILHFCRELETITKLGLFYADRVKKSIDDINGLLKSLLGREMILQDNKLYITRPETKENVEADQEIKYFSPGEQSLLVISLVLLGIGLNPDTPTLILIDELEMHLHPAALMELYGLIKRMIAGSNCCVFIATHSVFLLSECTDPRQICYFENGCLQSELGGRIYRAVVDRLLYSNRSDYGLEQFIASVDDWSYAQFMSECFLPPTVVGNVNPQDEQYRKMKELLNVLLKKKADGPIQILDYGAGDARIGRCMEIDCQFESQLPELIYHIYDQRYITKEFHPGTLFYGEAFKDKEDVILLYNVLHEVSIDEWEDELNFILSLLNPDGFLIFSERKTLSMGERPYGKSGYLLLGMEEIRVLFKGLRISEIILEDADKTVTCVIQNTRIIRIDLERIKNALDLLYERINGIIVNTVNSNNKMKIKPRDYAFYCQQYINAKMAIQQLSAAVPKRKTITI